MISLLGLIIVAFFITSFLLVPFIDFLFYLKRSSKKTLSKIATTAHDINTPIHNKLLSGKDISTPVGGGLLIIPVVIGVTFLTLFIARHKITSDIYILIFTLISFGLIGLPDDLKKMFISFSGKFSGTRSRFLLLLQILFALTISTILYFSLGLNNVFIPVIGNLVLGWWYIPFATFVIVSFANAFNISDGLDGLSTGLLTICLFAFLALAQTVLNQNLAIFSGIWIGALIAYLYFNVFPARIYLGDAGAFGFGAALAVTGLLTGKILGLAVIGGVYIIIVASSLIQIISKKLLKRKILPVTPIHMYFKYIGWEEPKIVMRFWLLGAILAIFGLWLALLSK